MSGICLYAGSGSGYLALLLSVPKQELGNERLIIANAGLKDPALLLSFNFNKRSVKTLERMDQNSTRIPVLIFRLGACVLSSSW